MQPINEALSIMVVGMITVFFILILIVVIGRLLIKITNKYIPSEQVHLQSSSPKQPSDSVFKAVEAAIDKVTNGKGRITSIKKI